MTILTTVIKRTVRVRKGKRKPKRKTAIANKKAIYEQPYSRLRKFKDSKLGKMGAASEVRRIDPETMEPIEDVAPPKRMLEKAEKN